MYDIKKQNTEDPTIIFRTAIEQLDVFTQLEASRLEVGDNGHLIAAKESRLERVVSLARCFMGPLLSNQMKQEQEKKLLELKKVILWARDVIQNHSPLIEILLEGNEAQRQLADFALLSIQRYNAIVKDVPLQSDVYNYERHQLLLDDEIKGHQIELSRIVSIQYDSHPTHPAHQTLKELSQILRDGAVKDHHLISHTHKKNLQFMIDAFHMKAIRMIKAHLQKSTAEIVPFIKQKIPEVKEEGQDLITMQQLIEFDSGPVILVTGRFKKNASQSKFMTMPILDSFKLIEK